MTDDKLEQAAREHVKQAKYEHASETLLDELGLVNGMAAHAFIAGATWQAEQAKVLIEALEKIANSSGMHVKREKQPQIIAREALAKWGER